jgi:hypothetical protein
MKIVFLDFDGVLNNWYHIEANPRHTRFAHVMPEKVALVKRLVTATNSKIVISSAWRNLYSLEELLEVLDFHGYPDAPIIDKTPCAESGIRGREIQVWLDNNPDAESFVILDDDNDMAHLAHRLVHTSMDFGITDEDVDKAIFMLNGPGGQDEP